MEVRAKAKNIRTSSRKAKLVADLIRGMKVDNAISQLKFVNKKVTNPFMKLLRSAIANAVNNYELEEGNLYIKEIRVDEGRTLKRWMPRARGRATPLRKRSCHIQILLGELIDSGEKKAKKQKLEAPIKIDAKSVEKKGAKEDLKSAKQDKDSGVKNIKDQGTSQKKSSTLFRRKSG